MSAGNRLQFSKQSLLCVFVIAVASQDTEKLILVQMENIVRQLEVLGHENSASEQRPVDKGDNRASSVLTRCELTDIFNEPETANQQRLALPAAEADDVGSHQKKMNTSTSPTGIVNIQAAYSLICDDPQKKTQADKSHNTEPSNEISYLRAELDSLRADLCHSNNTVSLLKHHIQLNTATDADGTPLPSLNPEVIVALAQEVERLNAELEKLQAISNSAEGRPNEQTKDTLLVSCDEAAAGDGGQRSFLSSPVTAGFLKKLVNVSVWFEKLAEYC